MVSNISVHFFENVLVITVVKNNNNNKNIENKPKIIKKNMFNICNE